jgi:multiple sugar transport system ATP-binding protein
MIAGLEEPTSGTIRIGGRVVNDVHPRDRDVAMVFQDYALYPHMTVRQNMSFGLKLRKTKRAEIERRVTFASDLLGLDELLERRPDALSGGQRQRVAVGRAIVREPSCHLLDEPLSSLDAALRLQMRAELKALHQRLNTTTVYVTHDQEEAMTLGDRLVVMAGGVVQQIGAPLEVYARPANRFVAGFLGSPPMNFIEGGLRRSGDRLVFADDGDARLPLDGASTGVAEARAGGPLVLGVRPERLTPAAEGGPSSGPGVLALTIRVIEPLGDRVNVYATTAAGTAVIARIDAGAARFRPGDVVPFRIDPGAIHLFEPGPFGRRLSG